MPKLVKESEYFVAWLFFWLSCVVGGFILGAVAGAIVGAILSVAGVDLQAIALICGGVGFVVSIPLSYVLFRVFVAAMIVKKVMERAATLTIPSPNQAFEAPQG